MALALLSLMMIADGASQADAPQEKDFSVVTIGDNVIVCRPREPGVGNCVAIITDRDVIVVDSTLTPRMANAFLAEVRQVTEKPCRYVINTHGHDDHIWGNQAFLDENPGLEIIAHPATARDITTRAIPGLTENRRQVADRLEQIRKLLAANQSADGTELTAEGRAAMQQRLDAFARLEVDLGEIRPTPPTVSVTEAMTILRKDLTIEIRHLGRGHSEGDLIVFIPEQRLLIAGDLTTLPVPAAVEAHVSEWSQVLHDLKDLSPDVIIPGHGDVIRDQAFLPELVLLFDALVEHARQAHGEGMPVDDTAEWIRRKLEPHFTNVIGEDERTRAAAAQFFIGPAVESLYREFDQDK